MNKLLLALPAFALVAACHGNQSGNASGNAAGGGAGVQITGAGSTFVYPVLSAWAADYQKQNGATSTTSRSARAAASRRSKAGTVDFGATDQPLASDELAQTSSRSSRSSIGGIVAGRQHRRASSAGKLKLTGPVLADIYAGQDQELERPGDRQDQSGPEAAERGDRGRPPLGRFGHDLQLHPLSQPGQPGVESGARRRQVGHLAGGVGGKGNEGVAGYVKQIPNSIGYVEYAYVVQNHMTYAALQNAAGNFVAPSAESFRGRGGDRRLGERAGLQPGDDQCAGRERLSDHRHAPSS